MRITKCLSTSLVTALIVVGGTACNPLGRPAVTHAPVDPAANAGDPAKPTAALDKLNEALLNNDKTAFMAVFAPQAAARAEHWWDNMTVLGMEKGGVEYDSQLVFAGGDGSPVDAVLTVGTRTKMDPKDDKGRPDLPGSYYAVTIEAGKITKWQPDSGVSYPWDQDGKLYVKTGPHVTVATTAENSALVDQNFKLISDAADWDFKVLNEDGNMQLTNSGFVVFLAGSLKQQGEWFNYPKHGPKGWQTEAGGLTYPMPWVRPTGAEGIGIDSTAGARVVVFPDGADTWRKEVFAHEMVHAAFARFGFFYKEAGTGMPYWAVEGVAEWLASDYSVYTPGKRAQFNDSATAKTVRQAVQSGWFKDKPPTNDQIYKSTATDAQMSYAVAAAAYAYLNEKYGAALTTQAARLSYDLGKSPFSQVVKDKDAQGNPVMFDEAQVQADWAAWMHKNYG